jgi:hypothetical protein
MSINLTSTILGEIILLLHEKGEHIVTIIVTFLTIKTTGVKMNINERTNFLPCYSKTFVKASLCVFE